MCAVSDLRIRRFRKSILNAKEKWNVEIERDEFGELHFTAPYPEHHPKAIQARKRWERLKKKLKL